MASFNMGGLSGLWKLVPGILEGAGSLLAYEGASTAANGALMSGAAARLQGERKKVALNFEADQLVQAAGQARAVGQREAMVAERQKMLVLSRALAVAGASGASASDPSVVNLLSRIEGEGAYRRSVAIYQGEAAAQKAIMGASARRWEGEAAEAAGRDAEAAYGIYARGQRTGANAGLVKGASGLFAKYGAGIALGEGGSMETTPWEFGSEGDR